MMKEVPEAPKSCMRQWIFSCTQLESIYLQAPMPMEKRDYDDFCLWLDIVKRSISRSTYLVVKPVEPPTPEPESEPADA